MPKITMQESAFGADATEAGQSFGVKLYEAGETYDVGSELARCFCDALKLAKPARGKSLDEAPAAPAVEETISPPPAPGSKKKDLGAAPENKAARLKKE